MVFKDFFNKFINIFKKKMVKDSKVSEPSSSSDPIFIESVDHSLSLITIPGSLISITPKLLPSSVNSEDMIIDLDIKTTPVEHIIGTTHVTELYGCFYWVSGMSIDADGCPTAYSPVGSGLSSLDYLENAGKPGNWYGLVTKNNEPVVQDKNDLAPGYYVSPTALTDRNKKNIDPRCYVDSNTVPYIAIPPELIKLGVKLGDFCWVSYAGKECGAIVADIGPRYKVGEGSISLAKKLGIPSSPKNGGTVAHVLYYVFVKSKKTPAWPVEVANIQETAMELFNKLKNV